MIITGVIAIFIATIIDPPILSFKYKMATQIDLETLPLVSIT